MEVDYMDTLKAETKGMTITDLRLKRAELRRQEAEANAEVARLEILLAKAEERES